MIAPTMVTTQPPPRSRDKAFDALYRNHHREILAYCLRRLPQDEAEDAAAEVFGVAWRRWDAVPAGDEALPWLFGVAHNVLSNHRRSGRRRRRLMGRLLGMGAVTHHGPETQVVRLQEHELLVGALRRLREPDREILMLATWEELPHRTIGDILGIKEAAVGQRIARARKRLGNELQWMERAHPIAHRTPDMKEV